MTAFVMLLHVMHMVFVLMGMFVSSRMNVFVVFVVFAMHDDLTSCGDESCRRASCQLLNQPF